MSLFLSLVIYTWNVLGCFTDPFEFDGDYGPEVNAIREKVFTQALIEDRQNGPLLSELVTSTLMQEFIDLQHQYEHLGFTKADLVNIEGFINRYGNQKIFGFLRHAPSQLLRLDKAFHEKGAREALSLLGSTHPLQGHNADELKSVLLHQLFTEENFSLTQSEEELKKALLTSSHHLEAFLGNKDDLHVFDPFCTPAGQLFFYWLYQALNLHLIADEPCLIDQINFVKMTFAQTIGNPIERAHQMKEKLTAHRAAVLFTQESDAILPEILQQDGHFLPINTQNPADGCFVFLNRDVWEPQVQMIPLTQYENYAKGKVNMVLATLQQTGEKFLLASCHGHSLNAEDGRLQIQLIKDEFNKLSKRAENSGLQLIIGIDANTKTKEDVILFKQHITSLGLIATDRGPTTIKRRLVTTQQTKVGKYAIDTEDYLITLSSDAGGQYHLSDQTVGFTTEKPDCNQPLPNRDNPSDHYPVGAVLKKM